MSVPIPLKRESGQSVKQELAVEEIIDHTRRVLEIKDKAMVQGVHFGIIPGYHQTLALEARGRGSLQRL